MGSLFTVRNSLSAISGVTTTLLVWLAASFWLGAESQRRDAARTLESMTVADLLIESAVGWAQERGLTHISLSTLGPVGSERGQEIDNQRLMADAAFGKALAQLRRTELGGDIAALALDAERQLTAVGALRQQIDPFLQQPYGPRARASPSTSPDDDPVVALLDAWFPTMSGLIMASQRLRHAARYRARTALRDVEALQEIKHAVWLMVEFAERERAMISATLAARDPFSLDEVERLSWYRGRLEQAWMVAETYAPRQAAAQAVVDQIERVRDGYFGTFEAIRAPIIRAGMADADYPSDVDEWLDQSAAALVPIQELGTTTATAAAALTAAHRARGERQVLAASVALVAAFVLAGLTLWFVITRIVRPLDHIRDAMTRLAGGDEMIAIPAIDARGEIGAMARAVQVFKETTERNKSEIQDAHVELEGLYHRVRRHADELEQRVAERTQELEAASQHKSAFLAAMSHELRTPMNSIIGFTRLVMRRGKDALPVKQYENLGKILISAQNLLALINDILDLSKIEAGRIEIRPDKFELEPLIDECLNTVEPLINHGHVSLETDLIPDLPPVFADPDKLRQVLINLLSNALKFTDRGRIMVTARGVGRHVTIAIADSGIGIPADALEMVFEEFRQVDAGAKGKIRGTGLGLPISRQLARLMDGDITVESEIGKGSTFTVTVPRAATRPEQNQGSP